MYTFTKTRLDPHRIADETFLIHNHHGEGMPSVQNDVSSSASQRQRVGGTASDSPMRSAMNQLMTSVALGHASMSALRLPV